MNVIASIKAPSSLAKVSERCAGIRQRMQAAHANHLGYPYNLEGLNSVPGSLSGYLINNLGDPYSGSHYASEVCDLEREAVSFLMDLWGCGNEDDYWGSIGASGTEGNFWALYLAREYLPEAPILHSADAHYSIPKAARILGRPALSVASHPDGSIDLEALATVLNKLRGSPVILALTCGTTVKGAHDDIAAAVMLLDQMGFGPDRRFIHVDGALNAMVLPFAHGAPSSIMPTFAHGIDSISTSGHKMIGTAMPCGVLIARKAHVQRISSAVAYLRSNDTTLMGSRNGHAVLAIWARLVGHGKAGYATDVSNCLVTADDLCRRLQSENVPAFRNAFSLTIVFPQPDEEIVKTYQLACNAGIAHAITMPNVKRPLMERFARDYLSWWKSAGAAAHATGQRQ